ncbi:hypothetical protein TeGR_g5072 [Tetraparma gracilis]|uniref:Uncharacterized protein n=1 Tax=Tetraparma gracilis TaxID=2962635 RepID=A0ABQ6MDI1_9STRA|nr:hypothetical protein TeGR_g5072 [Tetraparma gracilis]
MDQKKFYYSVPAIYVITILVSLIPVGDEQLGYFPLMMISLFTSIILTQASMSWPSMRTKEHKELDLSMGVLPILAFSAGLLMLTFCYLHLTTLDKQMGANFLVGMVLPVGTMVFEAVLVGYYRMEFVDKYMKVKEKYLAELEDARKNKKPHPAAPIIGDIEGAVSCILCYFCIVAENIKYMACIIEVSYNPDSKAWIVCTIFNFLYNCTKRTGFIQDMIRLLMKGLPESKVDDLTLMNGMSLGYQRCQYGTGYIAFLMAFAIGVYRRFVFNDVDAILWNEQEDNRMVWKVMLAVLGSSLLSDVWYNIQVSNGDVDFDMVAHKVKGKTVKEDPLGDDTYRNIPYRFYPFSFMASAFVIWSLYLTYLGPHFVFGICRETQFTGEDAEFSLWKANKIANCTGPWQFIPCNETLCGVNETGVDLVWSSDPVPLDLCRECKPKGWPACDTLEVNVMCQVNETHVNPEAYDRSSDLFVECGGCVHMNRTGCVGTWNDEGEWAMEDVRGEEADPPNPYGLCPLPEKVRGSIF